MKLTFLPLISVFMPVTHSKQHVRQCPLLPVAAATTTTAPAATSVEYRGGPLEVIARMMVPQSQPNLYGALNIATNCSHGNSCVVDASFIKMQALPPRK
jgi:hypothetical protein